MMRRLCALAVMTLVISAGGCGHQDPEASSTPVQTSAVPDTASPDAQESTATATPSPSTEQTALPDGFSHNWELHGLQLTVRDNGTAESSARTYDLDGCGGKECLEVKEYAVTSADGTVRLVVKKMYRAPLDLTHNDGLRPGSENYPSKETAVALGDYYTMTVQSDGNALATLHSSDGRERPTDKFNGLGTPWICTPQTHDTSKCGA